MEKKLKISRSFTFKAYVVNKNEDVLNDAHMGEFMSKSECHYYCEKFVLDFVKNNKDDTKKYLIYKISTLEDTKIKDMLIEQIYVNDGKIIIE